MGSIFRLLQTDGQMKKRGVKRANSGRRISRTIRGELKVCNHSNDLPYFATIVTIDYSVTMVKAQGENSPIGLLNT